MEDAEIVGLLFERQECGLSRAEEKYGGLCRSVAQRILADARDAEECASDALLRIWNAIPPERPRSLRAYLARITRNLALDRIDYNGAALRSSALTEAFEELEGCLASSEDGPERAAERGEFRAFLTDFLGRQSRDARVYFVRRYFYGERIAALAADCGVSEETVKSSLFRTRNRLRRAMEEGGVTL